MPPKLEGEEHPRARFTASTVRRLRRLRKNGDDRPPWLLAELCGVHKRTIQRMLKGDTYKNVDLK